MKINYVFLQCVSIVISFFVFNAFGAYGFRPRQPINAQVSPEKATSDAATTSLSILLKGRPVAGQGEKTVTGKMPSPLEAFFKASYHNDGSAEYEVFHDQALTQPAGFKITQEPPRKQVAGQEFPVIYKQNWDVAGLKSTITITLLDSKGKQVQLATNTTSADQSTTEGKIDFTNDIGRGSYSMRTPDGKVTNGEIKDLILTDALAGTWEGVDADKRFTLKISGLDVNWIERGTAATSPGATFTRSVRLKVLDGKLLIERANDNAALTFAGFKPQSLRDAILATQPKASFIVFTRDGDQLLAEWNGLSARKKPDGTLDQVIQPGAKPKGYTFKRL